MVLLEMVPGTLSNLTEVAVPVHTVRDFCLILFAMFAVVLLSQSHCSLCQNLFFFINIIEEKQLWSNTTGKNVYLCPDGRAEGVFKAPGSVSRLWCLKGLPESSGSAVWRLQGRTAGSRGQYAQAH